jgi:hypothetical protein
MKKYFIKIVPMLLIAVIFPMSGGLCFQVFLNQMPKVALAASAALPNSQSVDNMDTCSDSQTNHEQAKPPLTPAPMAPYHNNSLLPCCVDGGQPSIITTLSRLSEIEKNATALLFVPMPSPKTAPETIIYHPPINSPPNLLALKTTVLRL